MKRQNVRKAILFISMLLFPVTMNYLSPYVIIDGAVQGIAAGSFIMFGILFVSSLFLGRVFCSWVCPAAGLQDACFGANSKKVRSKLADKIKYIIWIPWISAIVFAAAAAGGLRKVDFLHLTENGISVDAPLKYITYYSVIFLLILLPLIMGKRASCHTICWMAPFMVLGDKLGRLLRIPSLHLEAQSGRCTSCKACEAKCPMSLEVSNMVSSGNMRNTECILCGECVDTCPKKAVTYSFGSGSKQQ